MCIRDSITGGEDLKLFEVDEVVNKIRSEVDAEAEVIIGAITDVSLDGKIRVSIVATSLDGQQPEGKSVINMVHRIQNRNPGYSDFTNSGSAQSFNFSPAMSNLVSHGANALKLEDEILNEQMKNSPTSEMLSEHVNNNEGAKLEDVVDNSHEQSFSEEALCDTTINETSVLNQENQSSNGLENFVVEEDTPNLFNSKDESSETEDLLLSEDDKDNSEDDDLEIPAFLRRQKN